MKTIYFVLILVISSLNFDAQAWYTHCISAENSKDVIDIAIYDPDKHAARVFEGTTDCYGASKIDNSIPIRYMPLASFPALCDDMKTSLQGPSFAYTPTEEPTAITLNNITYNCEIIDAALPRELLYCVRDAGIDVY